MAVDVLSKENIEKLLSKKQLAVWQCFQKAKEITTGEIIKKTKIVRSTVKQTLNKLLDHKKIERIGLGRSTRYRKIG